MLACMVALTCANASMAAPGMEHLSVVINAGTYAFIVVLSFLIAKQNGGE